MSNDKFTKLISFEQQGDLFQCLIEFEDGTQMKATKTEADFKALEFEQVIWALLLSDVQIRKLLSTFRSVLETNRSEAYDEGFHYGQESMDNS